MGKEEEDRGDSEDEKETWSGLPEEGGEEDVGQGGVKVWSTGCHCWL